MLDVEDYDTICYLFSRCEDRRTFIFSISEEHRSSRCAIAIKSDIFHYFCRFLVDLSLIWLRFYASDWLHLGEGEEAEARPN